MHVTSDFLNNIDQKTQTNVFGSGYTTSVLLGL